jgi:O-antigen/teichoic acid export membrane protein
MTTIAADAERPSLTRQAIWLLVAKIVGFGLTFALPLLLVRTLTQHDYGVYKQAFLLVTTALTVLPLGFGMTAFYFLPREPEHRNAVVMHVLVGYTIVGGLAAFVLWQWPGLLGAAFGNGDLAAYSPLVGAVIFTWMLASALDILPVACGDVRWSTMFIVGSQASRGALFLIVSLVAGSIESLLQAALVQGIAQIVVLLVYLESKFPGYWKAADWHFLRRQASYGVPLGFSALLVRFQLDLPQYFVSHHFGTAAYAIFAVGVLNLPLLSLLRESVGSVMLPRVSELEFRQDTRLIVQLLSRVWRKLALVYFPVYVCLTILSREFVVGLFTPQYVDSWPIFAVNLTLLPLGILMFDPITRAYASQRFFVLKLRIVVLAVTVVALALGTKTLGMLGVVTLVVVLQYVAAIISAWKLAQVMGVTRHELRLFAGVGRTAVAAVLAGVPCLLIRLTLSGTSPLMVLAICIAVYVGAYAALVVALGALSLDERATVTRMVPRRLRSTLLFRTAAE